MIPLRVAEIAGLVGGRLAGGADPEAMVDGEVVVDSRAAAPGGLFVALAGEHADGHDFTAAAVAAGAAAVLAGRDTGVPAVLVDDPQVALGRLARGLLDRLPEARVAGLTGSSGKTSTKDLLAVLLRRRAETIAPSGSFNNEVGLPLTVLRADRSTRFLALEYSARGLGHIAYLTGIAPPHVAAVLNVGAAHLGEFASLEVTAQAKGELVEALPAGGTAVLNADDPRVDAMSARTQASVVRFAVGGDAGGRAEVWADGVRTDERGRPQFTVHTPEASAQVALRLYGEHQVANALAAVALDRALGGDLAGAAEALAAATPASRWRMEVTDRRDGVTVVNDAYNANPDSMRAALNAVRAMSGGSPDTPGGHRRTWAVLGEMAELGEAAAAEHEALGRLAVRLDVARLVVVGPGALGIHEAASRESGWSGESVHVPDAESAIELLQRELLPGDLVLVKASRSIGLERVATALVEGEVLA